ncbi:unnamed protein product [Rhizophagus irregularis]|nr:unnamed protein product [Rhizophagus irregularis]
MINNDLIFYYECIDVIERNNSLRAVHSQARRAQSLCWFNNICSSWEYMKFKRHFRITKTTFEWLCTEIAPIYCKETTQEALQDFQLNRKSALCAIKCHFFSSKIRFPNNYIEFSNIAKKFKRKASIPYAIGAIDGSQIPIKAPKEYPMNYIIERVFIQLFYKHLWKNKEIRSYKLFLLRMLPLKK